MIVRAVLVKRGKPEYFNINVTEEKYILIKKRLILENSNIVNILKRMKKDGLINSIYMPSNKKIQSELDEYVKAKRTIKDSIQKMTSFFG